MAESNQISVRLTEDERDLLLSLLTVELDVEALLQAAEVRNGLVEIGLTPEDLDELIGSVAFEANHTEDRKLQRWLDGLSDFLVEQLNQYDDGSTGGCSL